MKISTFSWLCEASFRLCSLTHCGTSTISSSLLFLGEFTKNFKKIKFQFLEKNLHLIFRQESARHTALLAAHEWLHPLHSKIYTKFSPTSQFIWKKNWKLLNDFFYLLDDGTCLDFYEGLFSKLVNEKSELSWISPDRLSWNQTLKSRLGGLFTGKISNTQNVQVKSANCN